MQPNPFPMLPAKHFTFPVLRPLLTIMKVLKAMSRFKESDPPPVVLRREGLSNAGFLIEALNELSHRAGIPGSEYELVLPFLKDPSLWNKHPVEPGIFTGMLKAIEGYCVKYKAELGKAYREDKESFRKLYKDRVLRRKVLVVHSANDSPDVLVKNLSDGAYYEVDAAPLAMTSERSGMHHITCFLCTDSKAAMNFFLRSRRIGIDLFLSDLGREIPVLNMSLLRLVHQAQRGGMTFMAPPYATMKLLPAVEEIFVNRLAAFDTAIAAQEKAMAMEEEVLFRGMEEAELYAELIVEAHWKKTAGYALERTFRTP